MHYVLLYKLPYRKWKLPVPSDNNYAKIPEHLRGMEAIVEFVLSNEDSFAWIKKI